VSDTVIEFNGLTLVQVSQNQAAVVSDPQNHIFVIKNSGFIAYAMEGNYTVLSIVDQTHLPTVVKDKVTGLVLGHTHEVGMRSKVGKSLERDYIVATLYAFLVFIGDVNTQFTYIFAAWTSLQTIVLFSSVEMIWNFLVLVNLSSRIRVSHFVVFTHLARINWRCPRRTCMFYCFILLFRRALIVFSASLAIRSLSA